MSKDYYFKFNDMVLNDTYIITDIEKTLLPVKEYSTINIPTIDGEILNGVKYSPLVYTIKLLVEGKDANERDTLLAALRDILKVKYQVKIAFDERRFGYGMPTSELAMKVRTSTQVEVEFEITCFMPHFYANELKLFETETGTISIENEGGESVKPFMSVGFSAESHFVQLENTNSQEKILVGNYPSLIIANTFKEKESVFHDNCEGLTKWTQSSANIDADRTAGGTVALASNGNGIRLGAMPTGSTKWKGACYRANLAEAADEFCVDINMDFTSTGTNGDPSHLDLKEETIVSGSKEKYYRVTCSALHIRTGPSTSYRSKGTIKRNHEIYNAQVQSNGWLKFEYPQSGSGNWVYCSGKYVQAMYKDNTTTTTLQNWVVTLKIGAALMPSPKFASSTVICRIPTGTVVRVISSTKYREDYTENGQAKYREWFKMHTAYNGKTGYVCLGDMVRADQAYIKESEEDLKKRADDKTGVVELYGFDSNGSKLFSIGFLDDNLYYEYTQPFGMIGSNVVLKDDKTVPPPKTSTSADKATDGTSLTVTKYMSGKFGDWNDMWHKWQIERRKDSGGNYVWSIGVNSLVAGVIKKQMKVSNLKSTSYPKGALSYLVLYIGTNAADMSKSSDMAITEVDAYKYNKPSDVLEKAIFFKQGDILDLDFDNRQIYLNEQPCNHLLDIGSRFFDIDQGITDIKIISDDKDVYASAVINEKWIGDE